LLETQCATKVKEINAISDRLIETDFWPILSSATVIDNDAKASEVQLRVDQIKVAISDLHTKVEAVVNASNDPQSASKTSVQDTHEAVRPAKRRRIEDDDADMSDADDSIDSKQIEELRSSFAKLEDRVVEVENSFVEYEQNVIGSLDGLVFEKIEQNSDELCRQADEKKGEVLAKLTAQLGERSTGLEANVTQLGQDVSDLANEVAFLYEDQQSNQEIARLRAENEELRQRVAKVCFF
jgi:hypothetical protein